MFTENKLFLSCLLTDDEGWFEIQSNNHKSVDAVIWPRNLKTSELRWKKKYMTISLVEEAVKNQTDGSVTSLETDNYRCPAK